MEDNKEIDYTNFNQQDFNKLFTEYHKTESGWGFESKINKMINTFNFLSY